MRRICFVLSIFFFFKLRRPVKFEGRGKEKFRANRERMTGG